MEEVADLSSLLWYTSKYNGLSKKIKCGTGTWFSSSVCWLDVEMLAVQFIMEGQSLSGLND